MMNRYLNAVFTNISFFILYTAFLLITVPVAVQKMGEEFYGLWVVLKSLLFVGGISSYSLTTVVMKLAAESTSENVRVNKIMTAAYIVIIVISLITMTFFFIFRGAISSTLDTSHLLQEQMKKAVIWIALAIIPYSMIYIPLGFLLSRFDNFWVKVIEFISVFFTWVGSIVISLIEKNLVWLGIWLLTINLIYFFLVVSRERQLKPFRFKAEYSTFKTVVRLFGYTFLQDATINFFQRFDSILVGFLLGPTMTGVYSIGTNLCSRFIQLTIQATQVMVPYASIKQTSGERVQLLVSFRRLVRYLGLGLALIAGLLIVWMPEILSLWISPYYGSHYSQPYRILVLSYVFFGLCKPGQHTLIGMGKVKAVSLVYLFVTVLMTGGLFVLSNRFGLIGAVSANLFSVLFIILNLYVYRVLSPYLFWARALEDLGIGVFFPIFTFILNTVLPNSVLSKFFLSSLLGLVALIFIWRDREFIHLIGLILSRR